VRRNALFLFGCGDTPSPRAKSYSASKLSSLRPNSERWCERSAAGRRRPAISANLHFQGLEKTRTDAGRLRDFIERDLAQFPFALEAFAKRTFRHAVKTVLAQSAPAPPERAGRLSWFATKQVKSLQRHRTERAPRFRISALREDDGVGSLRGTIGGEKWLSTSSRDKAGRITSRQGAGEE